MRRMEMCGVPPGYNDGESLEGLTGCLAGGLIGYLLVEGRWDEVNRGHFSLRLPIFEGPVTIFQQKTTPAFWETPVFGSN